MQISEHTHLISGSNVNWVLTRDDEGRVVVVDTGYPGDYDALVASINDIGAKPSDVRAIVLTHTHIDHIGGAARLQQLTGAPVYAPAAEVRDAAMGPEHQLTPKEILPQVWRPRILRWTITAIKSGATTFTPVDGALPITPDWELSDLLTPVDTPGHTHGHVSLLVPHDGVIIVGDAMCTGHAISSRKGPQLLPDWFNADGDQTQKSLEELTSLDADILACGHGPVWRGRPADAVAQALGAVPST